MNLELKINSVAMALGQSVDPEALGRAHLKKSGPLSRIFKRLPVSQTLYQADNSKLECFEEGFCIYPCTHGYLNRDRQWKTKVSVYLENGRICKLEFQVVDGKYAASNFLERFQEACNSVLGEPVESTRLLTRWKNGTAAVTSILHPDKVNADFLMEIQEA